MRTSLLITAFAATALACCLAYAASPRQRWLRTALPAFPARVSAGLAAMVALKGFTQALSIGAAASVW